jgi:hypothetical protein
MVYGVAFLVGFLSQVVVGVGSRLFPLYAWLQGFSGTDFRRPPPSPHALPSRALQIALFLLWTLGVPLLAAAVATASAPWLRVAAALLGAAVVLGAIQHSAVLVRAARGA